MSGRGKMDGTQSAEGSFGVPGPDNISRTQSHSSK